MRRIDPRSLQLKIRVRARKGLITSKEDLIDAIESTIATGIVPDGIEIHWIDWRKGEGSSSKSGRLTDELATELAAFWLAISHEDTATLLRRVRERKAKSRKGGKFRLRGERVRRAPPPED